MVITVVNTKHMLFNLIFCRKVLSLSQNPKNSRRSRRLEVGGARKNGRAPVLSCSHYFQAPATQATQRKGKAILKIPLLRTPMWIWICMHMYVRELIFFICHKTKTTLLYLCCISVHMIVGLNAQSAGRYALIL